MGDTVDGAVRAEERTMYLETHPFGECVAQNQTRGRMCMNGQYEAWSMWDETYTYEPQPGRHDEWSMQLATMYIDDLPVQDCISVLTSTTMTCAAGDMVASSPETNLTETCMNGCGDAEHGAVVFDNRVMYRASFPDGPCLSETQYRARTCENGFFEAPSQWNGMYQFFYCNPGCGKGFLSGETRTIEETRFVERFPILSCNPEKRSTVETCVKGSLVREVISGETLTYDECIPGRQTSRHGDTEHRKVIMLARSSPWKDATRTRLK